MSYYDHATAMAFKLDRWGEERPLRNYELEALRFNFQEVDTPVLEQTSLLSFKTALRRKTAALTKTFFRTS